MALAMLAHSLLTYIYIYAGSTGLRAFFPRTPPPLGDGVTTQLWPEFSYIVAISVQSDGVFLRVRDSKSWRDSALLVRCPPAG